MFLIVGSPLLPKNEEIEDEFIFINGAFSKRDSDRASEHSMSFQQWQAAATSVANETHRVWGEQWSVPLAAHHNIIATLANTHGWTIAQEYDIRQCMSASNDKRHDLSTLDEIALMHIATEIMTSWAAQAPAMAYSSSPSTKRLFNNEKEAAFNSPCKHLRSDRAP
ncbi:hypothetical protein M422DRAFT_45040 [Sphaerobolus stellatus SS14]|nr:hypothetical protein M422DRAFT_45040 [Sphaerobolus stellatus SS14]